MSRSDEIRANISNEYEKTPGYLIWDIAEATGQVMDNMDNSIAENRARLDVANLTGDDLRLFVKERKGILPREATYAVGEVTVTGNGTVTEGDLFETPNGVQFRSVETVSIVNTGKVSVNAVLAGNVGVVGAGSITQMPVTIEGIVSCTNEEATHDGYDAESDDSIRERYFLALQTPASSANKASYRNWALEVSGVGDAEVFPLAQGDWTVDVVIIDVEKKPASELLVQKVQEFIDPGSTGKGEGEAPIGASCFVSAATGLDINISAKISTSADHGTVEKNIKTQVAEYLASIAFTGANVSYAQIGNAILDVPEVIDYENLTLNDAINNIPVPERNVAIVGTVTLSYE